jgi:hypothetical protein
LNPFFLIFLWLLFVFILSSLLIALTITSNIMLNGSGESQHIYFFTISCRGSIQFTSTDVKYELLIYDLCYFVISSFYTSFFENFFSSGSEGWTQGMLLEPNLQPCEFFVMSRCQTLSHSFSACIEAVMWWFSFYFLTVVSHWLICVYRTNIIFQG